MTKGYGTFEELKQSLLYKTITNWGDDFLTLNDNTKVTIECSEQDCCASAGGTFYEVDLDAVITDVRSSEETTYGDPDDMTTNCVTITVYHNQNPIAYADCEADNGNGGYYYSVCSLVVNGVHHPVVSA